MLLLNSSSTSHNVSVSIAIDAIKEATEQFSAALTVRSTEVPLLVLLPNTALIRITDDSGKFIIACWWAQGEGRFQN